MGVRSTYTIHIDKKTDAITTAWIGPDQANQDDDLGPGQDRERDDDELGSGNWGWPFCQAGNRWGYRVKAPDLTGGARGARSVTRPSPGGRRRRQRPDRRATSTAAARSSTTRRTTPA